jgi:hypothetical protein
MAKTLAPARNALIGLHLDQQVILAWKSQAGKLLTWRTHVIGNADVMSLNGSDFHVFLLVCFRREEVSGAGQILKCCQTLPTFGDQP